MIPVKGIAAPKTIEEAARRQLALLARLDDTSLPPLPHLRQYLREASMKDEYHMAHAPELGMGMFSTDSSGQAHDCTMEWFADGKVLLCIRCWRDGA